MGYGPWARQEHRKRRRAAQLSLATPELKNTERMQFRSYQAYSLWPMAYGPFMAR
jgi:hypothetical protein